ncbi:MAG: hypothetical protein E7271_07270 [Lachnospiraceae bacterium]|jgi:transcription elongation factor Elf1|nr:hypothetical protein [Lachnospiraceae bacterium]
MYTCKNCAGNLQYDIESGKLKCSYCKSLFDPYEVSAGKEADEENEYEVTVFTCPQCAGRIYSMDTQALAYCSFCGASSVLEGRLERIEHPKYIIPFTVSKEDCKRIYSAKLKRVRYAPNWLKDAEHIDSFRGIYIPYWIYNASQNGPVEVLATKKNEKRIIENNQEKIKVYSVYGDLECEYRGVAFDASATFEDELSEQLTPFDMRKLQEFSPAFLNGFYADIADVNEDVYMSRAEKMINDATTSFIDTQQELYDYHVEPVPYASGVYHTMMGKAELAMLPVWLLTYRRDGRVARVAINGQTGKLAGRLPIDRKKYIGENLFWALPVFATLGLLLQFLDIGVSILLTTYMMTVAVLCIAGVYAYNIKKMWEVENLIEDEGFNTARVKKIDINKRKTDFGEATAVWITGCGLVGLALHAVAIQFGSDGGLGEPEIARIIFGLGLLFLAMAVFMTGREAFKGIYDPARIKPLFWVLIAFVIVLLCFVLNVSDIIRCAGIIVSMLICVATMLRLVRYHNRMITRTIPQYKYKGGADNE